LASPKAQWLRQPYEKGAEWKTGLTASPYSPPMVTSMAQESEQITLANILREMEVSRRETFDQLRADRRQSEIFL